LAEELVRDMANPPRHLERRIRGWAWLATAMGGTGSPAHYVHVVPAPFRD
jgi:hypothetical protein